MNQTTLGLVNELADRIFFLAVVPAIAFPFVYLRSAWRSTAPGRSVMMLATAIAAIFAATLVQILWPDYPLRPVVRVVLYVFLTAALWRNLVTLLRAQHVRREEDRHDREVGKS